MDRLNICTTMILMLIVMQTNFGLRPELLPGFTPVPEIDESNLSVKMSALTSIMNGVV